mmetsp:Transcript_12070/g.39637  ORF Transcript_12070/g.39637 Transcript_12070/m.39637 type:complete len:269 (-) Transcript_12070:395-1201(-)
MEAAKESAGASMPDASDRIVLSTLDSSIFFQTGGLLAVRSSCSWALAQTSRHSGSEISSLARSRAGRSMGTNGATSYGSSQSLAMFSTMRAQLRLIEVVGTSNPRLSSGFISASADASMSCTKTTPASLCTVSAVFSGLMMHSMISGMKVMMSLLSTVLQAVCIDLVAASLTWTLVSYMRLLSTGITSVRWRAICAGCFDDSSPSISARAKLPCHLPSHSGSTYSSSWRTALGEAVEMSAWVKSVAASCTDLALSERLSMASGSSGMR